MFKQTFRPVDIALGPRSWSHEKPNLNGFDRPTPKAMNRRETQQLLKHPNFVTWTGSYAAGQVTEPHHSSGRRVGSTIMTTARKPLEIFRTDVYDQYRPLVRDNDPRLTQEVAASSDQDERLEV